MFSISLALDYSLWGLNPLGFHLTNILLHAISTVLLYLLGRRLQNTTGAVFASLLFALHPIQAHAVNVIATRADLLTAFFSLLSLQAFFSRRTISFTVMLVLALLSKETSMVLPVALLFAGLMIEKERPDLRLILAFAILGAYLVVRLSLGFSFSLIPLIFSYDASTAGRALLAFKVLALYFFALLNPFEIPHPFWTTEVPGSSSDPGVVSGIVILLLLLGIIGKSWKKEPVVAFGFVWFAVYFLPISNLKELNQPMAEHWLYLPMIGLSLTFGTGVEACSSLLPKRHPMQAGIVAAIAVFLIFAALVVGEKTKVYQDNETFLLAVIRVNPRVAGLYRILGNTYVQLGDTARAKQFYVKALDLDPEDLFANERLGFILQKQKQPEEAKIYLTRVTQYNPTRLSEIVTVAHAWELLGDKEKALSFYRKAFTLNPQAPGIKEKLAALGTRESRPVMPKKL